MGGGEARKPNWRGRIKGVEGLKPMCEDDGGCVGSGVRNLFCPVKFSYHTANPPPIILTHRF